MRLINPVRLRVTPLDPDASPKDELARRGPLRPSYKDEFLIDCQLDPRSHDQRLRDGLSGYDSQSSMRGTIRHRDATAAGWRPQIGDRVRGWVDRDGTEHEELLYVADARASAAWFGGHTTWVLTLVDRAPVKQTTA